MKKDKQQSYNNMVGSKKKVSDNVKSTNKNNNNSKVNFGLTDTDESSEDNKETNSNITDCK